MVIARATKTSAIESEQSQHHAWHTLPPAASACGGLVCTGMISARMKGAITTRVASTHSSLLHRPANPRGRAAGNFAIL